MLQHPEHHEAHQGLRQFHDVFQGIKGRLGLHHPELRQVAPGLGFFGPKGGAEAIHPAQGHGRSLQIELAALGQVGLAPVQIVRLKEAGGALAGRGGEDGGVYQHEAAVVEEVPAGPADFVPDSQNGLLPGGPQPQVAPVHEEGHPVFLGGDGIFRGDLDGDHPGHFQLIASGSPGLGPDQTFQHQGRFQGKPLELLKIILREPPLDQHSLGHAGAVPEHQKADLAAGAQVIDPTPEGHGLAGMLGQGGDVNRRGGAGDGVAHGFG